MQQYRRNRQPQAVLGRRIHVTDVRATLVRISRALSKDVDRVWRLLERARDATLRRNKPNDPDDIHFALRVKSYRETLAWLREKGFRDDVPAGDLRKMELLPTSLAGWPQIYILDPDRNIIEFSFEEMG